MSEFEKCLKYIEDKIINALKNEDWIFLEADSHTAKIKLFDKFVINIWMASGQSGCGLYCSPLLLFDGKAICDVLDDDTKKSLYEKLLPHVIKYKNEILIAEKERELAELKSSM